MSRSTAQNLDFTDIYMNQEKIMEVFNKQEKRNSRFDKQLVMNHKSYGNKIYKKRQDEYFEGVKGDQYMTPFLRLREAHRWNSSKLTKAQKNQQVKSLQNRRKKKQKVEINYIKAYQNDMKSLTADQIVGTLNDMQVESQVLFDANQKKADNSITTTLIEALAKERLNKMSSNQLVHALEEYNKSQTIITATNKQIQADDEMQRAQYKLYNQQNESSSSMNTSEEEAEDNMDDDQEKLAKESNKRDSVANLTPYSNLAQQSTNHFSFEERFKAFIGLKVSDNMQILQEKRRQEYNIKVNQMLEGDIDKLFTNAEFRKFIDPLQQECMLIDLTHQFINRAVVKGYKNYHEKENRIFMPASLTYDNEKNNRKSSQRSIDKASPIGSVEGKKGKGSKKPKNSKNSQDDELIHFCPNLGLDFSKIKSLYDIRDKDKLFHRVQYVLERMDKERYKAFRSGRLSLAQCVSRVEAESKGGLKYTVLDDLRHEFDEEALKKPTQATRMAYNEQVIEDRLLRNAKKRGIDPVLLKKTARNLNVQARCAKSMYARPMKKNVDFDTQQGFKLEENKRQKAIERKQMLDIQKREEKITAIEKKDKNTIRKLHALSLKDPRAEYRESCESKTINNRLYGQKYYFIPERYREALLEEFHKTYDQENQKNKGDPNKSTPVRPVGKKQKQRSKNQMTASQEMDWLKKMGYDMPLDDETRHYLKRMRKDNPGARIELPEGFYDSDEEEEIRKRKQLTKKMTGGVMTVFEVGQDGNLMAASPLLPKRSAVVNSNFQSTQNSKSGQINNHFNNKVATTGQDRQVLGALSVTQEQHISSSNASQVEDLSQQNQQQKQKLTIYHQGQTLSDSIADQANSQNNGIGVALIISHNGKEIQGIQQQQILSPNQNDFINYTEEIGDNQNVLLNNSKQYQSNGGIIEDPKQRKRTASAIDKYRQGSALDGMDQNASLQDNYGCENLQQKIKSPGDGRNTQMQLNGVFDKNSNFPLTSFQTGNVSTISKNFIEIDPENNDKIEPDLKITSPQVTSKLAKRTSQALIGNKTRSLINNSSIASYQQRTNQRKEKKLSQETLVIGGLVKNKSSAQVRNKSALSREYHSRHTRHIRGQSALSRPTIDNKLWQNRTSLQSTKFTQQTLSQKESVFGPVAEPQSKVPDSVLEWYNEMIGPVQTTQKFKDQEASVMDYENQQPYDMQQQLAATASLKIGRHRNRGAATAQKQSAKISTVEQNQQTYMTLNYDISGENEIDFAFTVRNGRSIKGGNASTKNDSISLRYAFDENKTFKGVIFNTQGCKPSTSQMSEVSPLYKNRAQHTNHNRIRGITPNSHNPVIKSQSVEKVNQMAGMSQTSQINSFDWTNLQTSNYDTQQQPQQRKGYNWLTGANMTENNLENLKQVNQHIFVSNNCGTNLFLNERAPRQLLVNESVLQRNKIYRQQGTQIQPISPTIGLVVGPGGAEVSQNGSEPEIRYPATRLVNQAEADESSSPDRDSASSRNIYMVDATGLHQQNFSSDYDQQVLRGIANNPLVAVTTSKTMFDVIRSQQQEHQLLDLNINNSTMGGTQIIQPLQQNRVVTGVGSTERRAVDSSSTNRQRQNYNVNQADINNQVNPHLPSQKTSNQPSHQVSKFANLLQANQDMVVVGVRAKSTGAHRSRPATSVARPQEKDNDNKTLLKIHRMGQPEDLEETVLMEPIGKVGNNRKPATTVNRNKINLIQNPNPTNPTNQSQADSVISDALARQNHNQGDINVIMKGRTIQNSGQNPKSSNRQKD